MIPSLTLILVLLVVLVGGLLAVAQVRRARSVPPSAKPAQGSLRVGTGEDKNDVTPVPSGTGQIEGRIKASSMKAVGGIVDKHPDEVVSVLRRWIRSGDSET